MFYLDVYQIVHSVYGVMRAMKVTVAVLDKHGDNVVDRVLEVLQRAR